MSLHQPQPQSGLQKTAESDATGTANGERASGSIPAETIEGEGDDSVPIDFQDGRSAVEYLEDILSRIRKFDVFAASEMIQILYPIELNAERIVLGIESHQAESLVDTCREHLQRVLGRATVHPVELNLVPCEPNDPRLQVETVYARQRRLDQEARAHRKECVRTDETVVRATEVLGGELIDVKLRAFEKASQG